ncbi:hypothetical protein D3C80_1985210 [compost metagenome]
MIFNNYIAITFYRWGKCYKVTNFTIVSDVGVDVCVEIFTYFCIRCDSGERAQNHTFSQLIIIKNCAV